MTTDLDLDLFLLATHAEQALAGADLAQFFADVEAYVTYVTAHAGLPARAAPDLKTYDVILVNSSAGKDSQAMESYIVWLCDRLGVDRSRILVVHCDLGRVEWPGTKELARRQAQAYGLRFVTVARDEDLLDQVVTRRRTLDAEAEELEAEGRHAEAAKKRATPAWMSGGARYCTTAQKTGQVLKLMTRLADAWRAAGNKRPIRILNCIGIRAAESWKRAKKVPFGPDPGGNSLRTVDRWLPIFGWSDEQVWDTIRRSTLPYHPAYDLPGVTRLSCVFCPIASEAQLVAGARANPALAAQYLAVEIRVGHAFKHGLSMAEICAAAAAPTDEGATT